MGLFKSNAAAGGPGKGSSGGSAQGKAPQSKVAHKPQTGSSKPSHQGQGGRVNPKR